MCCFIRLWDANTALADGRTRSREPKSSTVHPRTNASSSFHGFPLGARRPLSLLQEGLYYPQDGMTKNGFSRVLFKLRKLGKGGQQRRDTRRPTTDERVRDVSFLLPWCLSSPSRVHPLTASTLPPTWVLLLLQ